MITYSLEYKINCGRPQPISCTEQPWIAQHRTTSGWVTSKVWFIYHFLNWVLSDLNIFYELHYEHKIISVNLSLRQIRLGPSSLKQLLIRSGLVKFYWFQEKKVLINTLMKLIEWKDRWKKQVNIY